MTAKKMADVFFGKFSELISSKEISRETKTKIEKPSKVEIKFNNKVLIYISALVLLGLVIYFIF
jgi:hypothetical protein